MALSRSLWYLSEEEVEGIEGQADLETPERVSSRLGVSNTPGVSNTLPGTNLGVFNTLHGCVQHVPWY